MILEPAENAELLRWADDVRPRGRSKGGQHRDLVLCMERHRLLVAVDGERLRTLPSDQGPMLLAFTDDEAARAWTSDRHPADATTYEFRIAIEQIDGSEEQGRRWWCESCDALGAQRIVVNPAGPNHFPVSREELQDARSRLRRRHPSDDANPWTDLEARATARARGAERSRALAEAVASGDDGRFDQLRHLEDSPNAIGDGEWVQRNQLTLARWEMAHDQWLQGMARFMAGSILLGRIGDPYRCIDGLLDAVEMLRGLGSADGERRLVAKMLPEADAALTRCRVGYRDAEIDAVHEWALAQGLAR